MRYDHYVRGDAVSPPLIRWIRTRLYGSLLSGLKVDSVLEVGVGRGEFAAYCRSRNLVYTGVEPHPALRERLSADGYTILEGRAPNLPSPGARFDCVFAAHVIEHLRDADEVAAFIERSRELLNPGGVLILLYPDVEFSGWTFFQDYTHQFPTTRKRVEDLLADGGYRILRSRYYLGHFTNPFLVFLAGCLARALPLGLLPSRVKYAVRERLQTSGFTISAPEPT